MQGILNVMKHSKMISKMEPKYVERMKTVLLTSRKWLRAPTVGMFIPEITNGNEISKGQEMGLITDTYARHSKIIKAPFDGFVFSINNQAVVNQGDTLFHVGMLVASELPPKFEEFY
jgi:predicted deacylase